jgi:hypothetical protein
MPTIVLYQVCYKQEHYLNLTPSFFPYEWHHNPTPELRESAVYLDFYKRNLHLKNKYSGIFSPKFEIKTKILGADFLNFITNNPGYDVYFINPFPQNTYHSFNVWEQGEAYHPGLREAAQELFNAAGVDISIPNLGRNDWKSCSYSNYWVASSQFWDLYIENLLKLVYAANLEKDKFFSLTYHNGGSAPLFPFISERLISSLLVVNSDIKALAYPYTYNEILNHCLHPCEIEVVKNMKESIDKWDLHGVYTSDQRAVFSLLSNLIASIFKLEFSAGRTAY